MRISHLVSLFLACAPYAAQADIFGYTDEAGTLVLSDVKQDHRYALLLQTGISKNPALAVPLAGGRINWANQKRYGVKNLNGPRQNVNAGAHYLRDLLRQFDNDLSLVLAAYNAGENAVLRYGKHIPPYRETTQYVPRVLALYKKFQAKI
jgi:hypothetical protein